jgi:hypothetical protein
MRRLMRFGLAALVLLLVLIGAYAAFWYIVAARIEDGVANWVRSARAQNIDAAWQKIEVGGFPLAFRVELDAARLRDDAVTPSPELRIPALAATARPWDFANWRLAAPEGLAGELAGAGGRPPLRLAAKSGAGAASVDAEARATIWLDLTDLSADAGERVEAGAAKLWIMLPAEPPQTHADPAIRLAADLRGVRLPAATRALSDVIDELALGITLKGVLPNGPLAQVASAWRDSGGTIELDNLRLRWSGLGATATGTIALDRDLQPIGGFSGAIEGYDQILAALAQSGQMRASDARLARLALTMLAKAGPDGRPQISTSFTIQNGQMFLGPAKLGPAPRIAWQ